MKDNTEIKVHVLDAVPVLHDVQNEYWIQIYLVSDYALCQSVLF